MWQGVSLCVCRCLHLPQCANELVCVHFYEHVCFEEECSWEFLTLFSHHAAVLSLKGGGEPCMFKQEILCILLFRRDMLKECSLHIKKALVLLSASQLCSRWDQISLLVRFINYEGNNQDEKWLHLTVKIWLLTIRHQAGPSHTWVLADTQTAWIDALLNRTRKTQILQNIFWSHGQWYVRVAMRKYSYLKQWSSTYEKQ